MQGLLARATFIGGNCLRLGWYAWKLRQSLAIGAGWKNTAALEQGFLLHIGGKDIP